MKQIATFLISLFFTVNIQAQNAEAQIIFEEAEALYNEFTLIKTFNAENWAKYLFPMFQKLNEVEKMVGEKPKTLYLRAMGAKKMFEVLKLHMYSEEDKDNVIFTYVEILRSTSKSFMELKKNDDVDDRYREMRQIYNEMQNYPKTLEEWQKEKDRLQMEKKVKEETE